ncbi:MAG: Smr/MutS family protein [Christensenellales bacterium]|jgi:DNA-nicking Smr family endonuclease
MELDLHGKNLFQARIAVQSALTRATSADYRLTIIHGYIGGTALRDMICEEFAHHPPRDPLGARAQSRPDRIGAARILNK